MKRLLIVLSAVVLTLITSAPVFADEGQRTDEDQGTGQYLALGDSVAFGFTPPEVTPVAKYFNAANFIGYPEMVAAETELKDNNASCAGEATGGFISLASTNDNGCLTGYRRNFPLHVAYTTSQLDYAVHFLKTHRNTKLVTINLGANDVFHQLDLCNNNPTCFGTALPGVLKTIKHNLQHIFGALRAAGYHGQIVALTYYALDYGPGQTAGTIELNQTMIDAAKGFHVRIASGFDAFAPLAKAHGGSACAAHLIILLPSGKCDVHPTQLGHSLLADAILDTISHGGGDN